MSWYTTRRSLAMFQSTRPARGATRPWPGRRYGPLRFNPRAPHGARRDAREIAGQISQVSIHAPRTGRDPGPGRQRPCRSRFNPRAPHGARLTSSPTLCACSRVSIHAPRTGRDRIESDDVTDEEWFQSTRPARGATAQAAPQKPGQSGFNPRAPHGARRLFDSCQDMAITVSIHAPRTGRDHQILQTRLNSQEFQSTRPARGATQTAGMQECLTKGFQSTRPARGATTTHKYLTYRPGSFNPRAPHGARRARYPLLADIIIVSIHAPRTGRDHSTSFSSTAGYQFQSTRPARGATHCMQHYRPQTQSFNPRAPHGARPPARRRRDKTSWVSIHAPRTGRDRTPPGTGVRMLCFNPRAPHGARQVKLM